jgi:hypothetical protein
LFKFQIEKNTIHLAIAIPVILSKVDKGDVTDEVQTEETVA